MSHALLLHRRGNRLLPSDQLAEEDMMTMPEGRDLLCEVKQPRSLPHHRLLFALLRKVAKSTPTPLNEKALLSYVKVRTGHIDYLPLGFGKAYEAPSSISFAQMSQPEFREFFDRVVQLILTDIAPNLPNSFADEFLAMLKEDA